MRIELDTELPFEERALRDIARSVSAGLEFLRGQRGEFERNSGLAHERVRAISRAVDRLEAAMLLLGTLHDFTCRARRPEACPSE